jgi:protein involved in polysaccharide export with SLBB domain
MKRVIFLGFITSLVIILTFFAAAAQQIPVPDMEHAYLIGPGDEIAVKVMGEPQFDFNATIDDEGMIQVPFFENRLDAKCRTEKDLRVDVTKLMAKYLRNPLVSLRVTDRKSRPPTSVIGEVLQPQGVILVRQTRLRELLSFVGGAKEEAGGMVQVFRTKTQICPGPGDPAVSQPNPGDAPYRLYSLEAMNNGNDTANPYVYPGDVIIVQKALPVYITGEVRAPQGIRLSESGTSLTQAIAMVGGMNREAKTSGVKVYRLTADKNSRDILSADIKLIKDGKQKDLMLEPYDIVEVDKAKKSIAQTILEIAVGAGKGGITSLTNGIGYRVMY